MRSWNEIRKAATVFSKRGKNPLVATAYMQSPSVLGWPRRKDNRDLWFHSDLKNVAFYFVNSLFLEITGGLSNE